MKEIDLSPYMDNEGVGHRILEASSLAESTIQFVHGDTKAQGPKLPWAKVPRDWVQFKPATVVVWSGYSDAGKSTMINQVAASFVAQGERVLMVSPETLPGRTITRMCKQVLGEKNPSTASIRRFHAWTEGSLWLYDQRGLVTPKKICALLRYFAAEHAGTQVFIDSLLRCGIAINDVGLQQQFVNELSSIAQDTNMTIHLIAHSRKGAGQGAKHEDVVPTRYDIQGAQAITDMADVHIAVWRERTLDKTPLMPDAKLFIDKNKQIGWEGAVGLWFNHDTGQFCETKEKELLDLTIWPHRKLYSQVCVQCYEPPEIELEATF